MANNFLTQYIQQKGLIENPEYICTNVQFMSNTEEDVDLVSPPDKPDNVAAASAKPAPTSTPKPIPSTGGMSTY